MPAPDVDNRRCWICRGVSIVPLRPSTIRQQVDTSSVRITDSNYGQTAALSRCRTCGFVFADPVPHPDVLDLYREMEDQPYQDSSSARSAQMRVLLDMVAAARPQARTLLDIGAGTGLLVEQARARGLAADGSCQLYQRVTQRQPGIRRHLRLCRDVAAKRDQHGHDTDSSHHFTGELRNRAE